MTDSDATVKLTRYDFDPERIGVSYCSDSDDEYGQFIDVEFGEGSNDITLSFDDPEDVEAFAHEMLEVVESINGE